MVNSPSPSTSEAAGSGAEAQRCGQAERSWSYKWTHPAGFCPDWIDPAGRGSRAGSTSGVHSRLGTRSLALGLGGTPAAETNR